ncbi:hypothetical protein HY357_01240 [Candidatus Roizmanbacteria bacterium]|nr:hypothetical protein [Candidatus Roizmanbacteria bacterium]
MEEHTHTHEQTSSDKDSLNKNSLAFLSVGILVAFLLLIGGVYWFVSKKSKGQVVFPAGINYTGTEGTPPVQQQRPSYDYAKMAGAANWANFNSTKKQYTFQYPPEMVPLIFPGDANDTVTFNVSDIPARYNLMVLVETISNYDAKMFGQQETFVRNYFKFFSGLKELKDIETYTTEKGLTGWKVHYTTKAGSVGSDNYFFVIPGQGDKIIHVNNIFPPEGQTVFNRLLNSLDIKR